jgi:hypothetical protein
MIRNVCSAILAFALLAGSVEAVWADTLVVDGDGLAPISGTRLDFGTICHGQPVSFVAMVAIKATGHPNNKQVFENGTAVTMSAAVQTGDGLSTSLPSPVFVMPGDWRSQPNNTFADPVSLTVGLTPTGLGTFHGKIEVSADGTNRLGEAISRSANLNVRAKVSDCAGPEFGDALDITVEATSPTGADVAFQWPSAVDAVDGPVPSDCDLTSPATLPLGTTLVSCTAEDEAENIAATSFAIAVVDSTPPSLEGSPGDLVLDSADTAVEWEQPTASDIVDGPVAVTCNPSSGMTFPTGTTVVSCAATDAAGNEAALTFSVTVIGPPTDPEVDPTDDDATGNIADSDGGPAAGELPDTGMRQPDGLPSPIGLGLLVSAGCVLLVSLRSLSWARPRRR